MFLAIISPISQPRPQGFSLKKWGKPRGRGCLVPAVVLTLETIEMSAIFFTTQNNLTSSPSLLGNQGRIQGEGAGGAHPPSPWDDLGRFLINTVQSLDRHSKSALSFDMYSQQFTLCYFPVKSPLLRIRF